MNEQEPVPENEQEPVPENPQEPVPDNALALDLNNYATFKILFIIIGGEMSFSHRPNDYLWLVNGYKTFRVPLKSNVLGIIVICLNWIWSCLGKVSEVSDINTIVFS